MGKSRTQTQTQRLDPGSQQYVNQMRTAGQNAAQVALGGGPFFTGEITPEQIQAAMSPYLGSVVDATRGEFDHLRNQAVLDSNQQATMAGAFGGSRHGVAEGVRLGELDRAQTSQIAGLMNQGYGQALNFAQAQQQLRQQQMMEPLWRQQQALGLMGSALGPVGYTQSQTTPGNLLGDIAGLGMIAGGLGAFGRRGLGGLFNTGYDGGF